MRSPGGLGYWGARGSCGARRCAVAPYFFEVEEAAWGGQYGGGCIAGGRAGSGGGWVVEGVVSRGYNDNGLLLNGISGVSDYSKNIPYQNHTAVAKREGC